MSKATVNVPRKDIEGIRQRLQHTADAECSDPKISYAIAKTLESIERELKAIAKAVEMPKAYQKERQELLEAHAERDPKGKIKSHQLPNGQVDFEVMDQRAWEAALKALKAKHGIAERVEKAEEFFESEVELGYYPIPIKADESPWKTPSLLANVMLFVAKPE